MTALVIVIAALLLAFGGACAAAFCVAFVRPRREPDHDDLSRWPDSAPAMRRGMDWYRAQARERVEITSRDGIRLRGELLINGDGGRVMVLMHGFHGDPVKDFAGVLRMYYDMGYSLLLPSQRAHGASDGRFICYGLKERYDCADWARFAQARLHPREMYLSGVSMGAATVMYASAQDLPGCVRGVIADCGYASPRAEFSYLLARGRRAPTRPFMGAMRLLGRLIAGVDIYESVPDALSRARLPVLLIHGEDDDFVPAYMSRDNYAACRERARLELFPGAGHGMSAPTDPERMRRVASEFMESCERAAPAQPAKAAADGRASTRRVPAASRAAV